MDLSPIIARLVAATSGFKQIGALADLAAADGVLIVAPAAYVVPLGESPSEDLTVDNPPQQLVIVSFSVILVLANRRDSSGEKALADLQAWRDKIKAALYGWEISSSMHDPILYQGGQLIRFADGVLWWADEFSTRTFY